MRMPFDGKSMPPGVVLRKRRPVAQDSLKAAAVRNYRWSNLVNFGGHSDTFDVVHRRLSTVVDFAPRQIARTIGWRSTSASIELIVEQGKSLCALYIQDRLKRSGIYQPWHGARRKLTQGGEIVDEVYPTLSYVGAELEHMHPQVHECIAQLMGFDSFHSEQHVTDSINRWSKFKFGRRGCNWPDVVSLYTLAGSIAVDCVKQGNPEYLPGIVKGVGLVLEEAIAFWIQNNGGWIALALRYREKPKQRKCKMLTIIFLTVMGLTLIALRYREKSKQRKWQTYTTVIFLIVVGFILFLAVTQTAIIYYYKSYLSFKFAFLESLL